MAPAWVYPPDRTLRTAKLRIRALLSIQIQSDNPYGLRGQRSLGPEARRAVSFRRQHVVRGHERYHSLALLQRLPSGAS